MASNFVSFYTSINSSEETRTRMPAGTTYAELLEDEGVNVKKVDVFVNDRKIDDLDDEIEDNDHIRTATRNYNSGC